MKTAAMCSTLLLLAGVLGVFTVIEPLPIGAEMPLQDHRVVIPDGGDISLAEAHGENGLLVVFICNTCPWVRKWENRFNVISDVAKEQGIGVIFLNANEALRTTTESLVAMRERAAKSEYRFIYAADIDNVLADAFGAARTPDAYLFDASRVLRYRGAIDDNARDSTQATPYLIEAMTLMTTGVEIMEPVQKAIGCTIKRVTD